MQNLIGFKTNKFLSLILVLIISSTLALYPLSTKGQDGCCSWLPDRVKALEDTVTQIQADLQDHKDMVAKLLKEIKDILGEGETKYILDKLLKKEEESDPKQRNKIKNALDKLLKRTINQVLNLGRGASPAFVEDWREFQLLGQFRGETIFRGMLFEAVQKGLICPELVPALQKIFNPRGVTGVDTILQRVNTLQPYSVSTRCTLPRDLPPLDVDFARGGGWETWKRTFSPQNNVAGLIMLSFAELEKQRTAAESADLNEAVSGGGYTAFKEGCLSDPGEPTSGDTPKPPKKTCTILGKTFSPASWVEKAAIEELRANTDWMVASDETGESFLSTMIGIVGGIVTRMFGQ